MLLHEATFDDELIGDAKAKRHSTTSEAIGVGAAMGARRVLLTHFSQRYQKIPSVGSLESLRVRLEDSEEAEDPMEGMEPPVNPEDEPPVEASTSVNLPPETTNQDTTQIGTDQTSGTSVPDIPTTDPAFASLNSMTNLIRPPNTDMKIGVAFDYMRVKVGDIIHLEKFTPALRELFKEAEKDERDRKAKRAAKEAFSDGKKDGEPEGAMRSVAAEDVQEMGGARGTRMGQSEKGEKKQKKRSSWQKGKHKKTGAEVETTTTTASPNADNTIVPLHLDPTSPSIPSQVETSALDPPPNPTFSHADPAPEPAVVESEAPTTSESPETTVQRLPSRTSSPERSPPRRSEQA